MLVALLPVWIQGAWEGRWLGHTVYVFFSLVRYRASVTYCLETQQTSTSKKQSILHPTPWAGHCCIFIRNMHFAGWWWMMVQVSIRQQMTNPLPSLSLRSVSMRVKPLLSFGRMFPLVPRSKRLSTLYRNRSFQRKQFLAQFHLALSTP